jgi:UDP-sugar transporter A1/2/3
MGPDNTIKSNANSNIAKSNSRNGLFYCTLLALQFGLQPLLASRFTDRKISKASIVIGTEITKIVVAITGIMLEPASSRKKIMEEWDLKGCLTAAAIPAMLYAIQNLLVQYGYTLVDSMTFNLLNQTKVNYAFHDEV